MMLSACDQGLQDYVVDLLLVAIRTTETLKIGSCS